MKKMLLGEKDQKIEELEGKVMSLNISLQEALDRANKVIDFEKNEREQKQIFELSKKVIQNFN